MPLYITPSDSTVPSGDRITLGSMVSDVAQWYGFDGDSERERVCRRKIQEAIHDLNARRLWRFNLIASAGFNITSGSATYSLSAVAPDLWKVYNLRKTGSPDYTLQGVQQSNLDTLFQSQAGVTGYPFARVDFNIYRDGSIKFSVVPDASYAMELRYFKLIPIPTDDNQGIDMPQPYQNVPKYQALYHMGLFVGSKEARDWKAEYERLLQDMKTMDEDTGGDEILRFMNRDEVDLNWYNYSQPTNRPRFMDFY